MDERISGTSDCVQHGEGVGERFCRQDLFRLWSGFDERDVDLHFVEMNYGRDLADGLRRRLTQDLG